PVGDQHRDQVGPDRSGGTRYEDLHGRLLSKCRGRDGAARTSVTAGRSGDRGLALAPPVPAPLEALGEALRLLGVDAVAERDRREWELAASLVDLLDQMPLVDGAGEGVTPPLDLLPEQRQVMVIAQMVREVMRMIGERADQLPVGIPDQA